MDLALARAVVVATWRRGRGVARGTGHEQRRDGGGGRRQPPRSRGDELTVTGAAVVEGADLAAPQPASAHAM